MRESMRKLLACGLILLLAGCAGGGDVYDDSKSTYEPTVTVNETIVDDANYKITMTDIVQKTHPDVGRIIEISFDVENKTDEDIYITQEYMHFDGEEISLIHLAFFELVEAGTSATVIAYVQEMEDAELRALESSLTMELQIVDAKNSETIGRYPVAVDYKNK